MLCEIIGRVIADPEILPRSLEFGLDVKKFFEKFCADCPPYYYAIAIQACDLEPNRR